MRSDGFFAHKKDEDDNADCKSEGKINALIKRVMRKAVLDKSADFVDQNDKNQDDPAPKSGVDGFDVFMVVRIFGGFFGHQNDHKKNQRDYDPVDEIEDQIQSLAHAFILPSEKDFEKPRQKSYN